MSVGHAQMERRGRTGGKTKNRRCPVTGKRKFSGRDQAVRAIALTKKQGTNQPVAYRCKTCGQIHLNRPEWVAYGPCQHCGGWHMASSKPPCPNAKAAA